MWVNVCGILSNPVFNGIIGIISLVVGIMGLIITIITMNTAGKIEKKINKLKSDAIIKSKFNEYKPQLISNLKQDRDAVTEANIVTSNAWTKLLSRIGEVQKFETIFDDSDKKKIEEYKGKIKEIIKLFIEKSAKDRVTDFIDISNSLINILEKGDYSL